MESPPKEEAGGELAMEIESSVTAEDWRRALSRVVPAVVVLRTTAPRAFDTEVAGASYATGFVVDKSRGIILTNRHVVKPGSRGRLHTGPRTATSCIFLSVVSVFVCLMSWFVRS
jgi:pro-apoptotic serine protease NMA111